MRRVLATLTVLAAACASAPRVDPSSLDEAAFDREVEQRFQYGPPEPPAQRPADPRAGRIADAAYFAAYPDYERAYTPQARRRARRMAARLANDAGDLSQDQFTLRVAEIVALADNAHSHVGTAFLKNTRRIPLRTLWFPDGLYVMRAPAAYGDLLGARVEAIDGAPVEAVYQGIRRYAGGTDRWRRQVLTPMLESPGLLHAAGVAADAAVLTLTLTRSDGVRLERRIEGEVRGQAAPISSTARLVFPAPADSAMPSLLARDAAGAPVYLSHPSELLFVETLPAGGLFIGMGHGGDTDDMPMAAFVDQVRVRVREQEPAYAVVDLRTNSGGDFTTTDAFARELPSLVGRVYVLTSGWTLSAAMHMAAALKQTAPDRVTLVGEEVGDRLQFWSEGGAFVLPNAPMIVSYTAGRHDFAGHCDDLDDCFWLSAAGGAFHVAVPTLAPDIEAPLTFAAYRALRDPAMEAVLMRETRAGSTASTR